LPSPTDGCTVSVYETQWTGRLAPTTMVAMATSYWPLFDLRVVTDRLVLRPLHDNDFDALIEAIDAGIHEPGQSPFLRPWADKEPGVRAREVVQFWWSMRAEWKPEKWRLGFGVWLDGTLVGVQDMFAKRFAVLREFESGSWLTRSAQGQGIGTEMRAALLWLAFDGLGAEVARSAAQVTNKASQRVSERLGYRENGSLRIAPYDLPILAIGYELDRATWSSGPQPVVHVENLEPCLPMFGLSSARL
jgi:RimJ/RimL family protein N-acetyltransferase